MKLKDIALWLQGEVSGDPDIEIKGVRGLDDAGDGDITYLAALKHVKKLSDCGASCVMVSEFMSGMDMVQLRVSDPQYAFALLLDHFNPAPHWPLGVDALAYVADDVQLDPDVSVQAFAHISSGASVGTRTVIRQGVFVGPEAVIGKECVIHPNVTILDRVRLGNRVTVHSGTVIGADGFGYMQRGGKHFKVPQVGDVVIGDDVEIGACVTIDRATTGSTVIGKGTKIDNLVQVAHNVKVGKNCILVAQMGIAGSTVIGDSVMIGGQSAIAEHSVLEDGTMIAARGGVMGHLKKGVYSGIPAIPHRQWLKASALFARLPEMHKRISELEKRLNENLGGQNDVGR
jgi:UDP-3-O-[3-hydroxymyristoyl] glucosamine N-acyltransferase